MNNRGRSRKLVLMLLLASGTCHAVAAPACGSAEAPSAPTVASNVPNSGSQCPQSWALIKPAEVKEPIENPFRLGWREWGLVVAGVAFLFAVSATAVRMARRRSVSH